MQLLAALALLATVLVVCVVVLLTGVSPAVIGWTATAALLMLAVVFVQRR